MTEPAVRIEQTITLAQLLEGIADAPPLPVTGISTDSRSVRRGDVFLACQGATHHGLAFVGQALAAGASAVVSDSTSAAFATAKYPVQTVAVPGLADRLGVIANRFFDYPSRHMKIAGVTGTNGKTTVAWLLAESLRQIRKSSAYIGTLGAGMNKVDVQPGLTTPACVDLHRAMANFRAEGADYVALEVSSHALQQNRVDGVHFDSALFTNLSRDHIDYHGDMKAYGEIKSRFVLRPDIARHIINVDTEFGRQLAARSPGVVIAVSTESPAHARGSQVSLNVVSRDEHGTSVEAMTSWGKAAFKLPLVGHFNVANAALVLAQLLVWDVSPADAAAALGSSKPPPGRMQRVNSGAGSRLPAVYIDYAHTPAGLEAVLQALRPHCSGRLWCVFGCGGDRDRGKRRLMGKTVATLADRAVVTNDNPRNESPAAIIAAVLEGMDVDTVAIEDRASAIGYAIDNAKADDVVLIAGKGHEAFQVIGNQRLPFSDYAVARARLGARVMPGAEEQ